MCIVISVLDLKRSCHYLYVIFHGEKDIGVLNRRVVFHFLVSDTRMDMHKDLSKVSNDQVIIYAWRSIS